jgi:hypothetical protein
MSYDQDDDAVRISLLSLPISTYVAEAENCPIIVILYLSSCCLDFRQVAARRDTLWTM